MMGRPHSSLVLLVTAFCLYSVTCETVRSLVLHHHHHHHHHHDSWVHDGLEKHVKKLTENGTIKLSVGQSRLISTNTLMFAG